MSGHKPTQEAPKADEWLKLVQDAAAIRRVLFPQKSGHLQLPADLTVVTVGCRH